MIDKLHFLLFSDPMREALECVPLELTIEFDKVMGEWFDDLGVRAISFLTEMSDRAGRSPDYRHIDDEQRNSLRADLEQAIKTAKACIRDEVNECLERCSEE